MRSILHAVRNGLRELAALDGNTTYTHSERGRQRNDAKSKRNRIAREPDKQIRGSGWWAVEPGILRMVHGVPHRVDRIRGLGNAVVPPVAEYIGRHILETEASLTALTES